MKKVLSVCLVLLTMVFVFGITASAEAIIPSESYDIRVGNLCYAVDSKGAYITSYEPNDITPQPTVVIPQTINYLGKDYSVIGIEDFAFASDSNLKEITISDNVEYIGQGAFKDCTSLETVTLGESVYHLGLECFANTKIKSFYLGQDVHSIVGAFKGCTTLESLTIDPANTALTTDGNAIYKKTTFLFGGTKKNGSILVYYLPSKAQGKITLKSDVGAIGAYAFYDCNDLEEVVAKDLMYVDSYSFCNSGIKKFSATELYRIEEGAFKDCKNLDSINLENVDSIGVAAFENCTSLSNVTLPENIDAINEKAFANIGITEITIYGDNCYIYESAFQGCENLKTVKLEDGVTYVSANAFVDCPTIETIYISKTVENFDDNAFNGCENARFQVEIGSNAYNFVKEMGYDFETVGNMSFFEKIINFFKNLINALFGWII